jgi:hypothetical protein
MTRTRAGAIVTALLSAIAILGTGCGQMTIRTWVTLIEEGSGGYVALTNPNTGITIELDILRLQGGFLVVSTMDTTQVLGPMSGTISLPDVRMAGEVELPIGKLCTWNDPEGSSGGSLTLNLLAGTTESELFLDAKATTGLSEAFGVPPVDFEQSLDMDLGGGLGLEQFLNAFLSGSPAGLFETSATMESTMDMMGMEATFAMTTLVTNGAEPPLIDSDLMEFCGDEFASQAGGDSLFYGINAKSAYLRHAGNDRPVEPLVISLAELGAAAGDTLRLKTVGTYSFVLLLKDGVDKRLGGVFSTTDEVLDSSYLFRIPGAIDTGANVNTWPSIFCIFGQCADLGGDDIPEDFLISPQLDIVVPAEAEYLITAPIDPWRIYGDNTGMGFGVSVEVNPE